MYSEVEVEVEVEAEAERNVAVERNVGDSDVSSSLFELEPLYKKDSRLNPDPILYPAVWEMYKKAEASVWHYPEVRDTLQKDYDDWQNSKKVSPEMKATVKAIIGFFSGADMIVNDNININLNEEIQMIEAKFFLGFQVAIENIHNEVYTETAKALLKDPVERTQVLNAFKYMPNVDKLYQWARKWIGAKQEDEIALVRKQYGNGVYTEEQLQELATIWLRGKRFVAFACIEGIFFSAVFCIIFWFKELGLFKGITLSNELISKDEGLHVLFSSLCYNMIVHQPPAEQVQDIVKDAVEAMKVFILTFMGRMEGMNAEKIHKYIEFMGDRLLSMLNTQTIYGSKNPFPFMEKISFNGLTNFFEKVVTDYSKPGFETTGDESPIKIDCD